MGLQFSVDVRNDMLDTIEATIGTDAILRIYSGSKPASAADAATGTLLAEMTLPTDWMDAAASGAKAKAGTWSDATANATDTAGYFRVLDSTGTTTGIQGECTDTGGAGPMKLSTTSIVSGQPVTIASFTLTAGNP